MRGRARPRRALFVSSPIGLGHVWRDVAIADQLRRRVPGLEIQWLAQSPVTTVLERRGEMIHPASAELASESGHFDREAGEHELNAFQALRRMDEILCANFMVFHDVVTEDTFDLWIGDEAWDVDHFLHENPELKTAAYAWLTDFVGYLPLPDGGEREAFLTADYNAEMIEHVERFPRVRDRAIFVGDPDDIVPGTFGPGLPEIRDLDRATLRLLRVHPSGRSRHAPDRAELRAQLGWEDGETICVVAVGGTAVGAPLLRRVIEALPALRERVPDLRMIAVAGPRIDPADLPTGGRARGARLRARAPPRARRLRRRRDPGRIDHRDGARRRRAPVRLDPARAAFRAAAARPPPPRAPRRPGLHRLRRRHARRLADAVARALATPVDYRPVPSDSASRAAQLISTLL